ncbi:MAG: hypothetical protein Ct9H300mP32_1310 [Verrucomicrobiota bacterium]|nr:MAG: hypothetical protein Ct9H300mP32_1310 [Verrucomicrobiota bacterium]
MPCSSTPGHRQIGIGAAQRDRKGTQEILRFWPRDLEELEDDDEPFEIFFDEDKEITEGDQDASVINFVNQVIWEAFKDRAPDIHFEPAEDEFRIRYRVDGILHQTRCRRS